MLHHHDHDHARWVTAAAPTFSLLRLSAWQRLAWAGLVLGMMWALVLLVLV